MRHHLSIRASITTSAGLPLRRRYLPKSRIVTTAPLWTSLLLYYSLSFIYYYYIIGPRAKQTVLTSKTAPTFTLRKSDSTMLSRADRAARTD